MSNVIEKEVVKMEFDNSDFEKKTKESMSTIEKLKKSLNFDKAKETLTNFARQANELDFNGLKDSIDTVAKRFSNLGIVGMTVISRLTNTMIDGVSRIAHSISGMIVSGGISRAMNIEKAKFQLQGLGVEWDKIKDDIDYGVKDTAYGLDAAAAVAAQLKTSGVEVGDGMKQALRAISGVASMTGSTYEDIGMIFTQVASQGRLMGDQLSRLSYRGLNAAGELGKALNKTEAEIREMASKGQIDFATFAKAMDDAFGAHAKDANKTLNGTLDNIRSAWGRIGAEFVEPIIRNEGELVSLLNAYRSKINDIKNAILPVAEVTTTLFNRILASATRTLEKIDIKDRVTQIGAHITELVHAFEKLWSRISYVGRKIKEVYLQIFPSKKDKRLEEAGKAFKKIYDAINDFNFNNEQIKKIQSIFKGVFSVAKVGIQIVKNLSVLVKPLFNYVVKEAGKMFDIAAAIGEMISKLVDGTFEFKDATEMIDAFLDSISTGIEWIQQGLRWIVGDAKIVNGAIEDASDTIYRVVFGVQSVIMGVIMTIVDGIGTILGLNTQAINSLLMDIDEAFMNLFCDLLDIYREAGSGAEGFRAVINEVFNRIIDKITEFVEEYTGIDLSELKEKVVSALQKIEDKLVFFAEKLKKPINSISNLFTFLKDRAIELEETLHGLGKQLAIGLGKIFENPVGSYVSLKAIGPIMDTLRQFARDGKIGSLPKTLGDISVGLKTLFASANSRTIATTALALVAYAYSLNVFAGAIEKLSKTEDFSSTMGSLIEMLLAMAAIAGSMVWILNTLNGTSIVKKKLEGVVEDTNKIKNMTSLTAGKIAATAVLVFAISKSIEAISNALVSLSTMESNPANHISAIIEVVGALGMIIGAVYALATKMPKDGIKSKMFLVYAATMVIIAKAVGIMADAFVTINAETSKIGGLKDFGNSLWSLIIIFGTLASLVVAINKIKIVNIQRVATIGFGVMAVASSVKLLVEAMVLLKDVDAEHALMGLVSVFALVYEVIKGAYIISGSAITGKTAFGILAMAAAIAILVHEIKVLASMPFSQIIKGFITIGALLSALTIAFSFFINELPGLSKAGFAAVEFAASLFIIVKAIEVLKSMDPTQVAYGFVILAGALFGMCAALLKLSTANLSGVGLQLVEVGAALYIIAQAISVLGQMDLFNILKAAGSLIIFLELLCVTVTKFTMAIEGAKALLLVAGALAVLAIAIAIITPLGAVAAATAAGLLVFVIALGAVAAIADAVSGVLLSGAVVITSALLIIATGMLGVVAVIGLFAIAVASIAATSEKAATGIRTFVAAVIELATSFAQDLPALANFAYSLTLIGGACVTAAIGTGLLAVSLTLFAVGATLAAGAATLLAGGITLLAGALGLLVTVLAAAGLADSISNIGIGAGKKLPETVADGIQMGAPILMKATDSLANQTKDEFNDQLGINSPSSVFAESGKYIDMGLAQGIEENAETPAAACRETADECVRQATEALMRGMPEVNTTLDGSMEMFSTTIEQGSYNAGISTGNGFMKGLQAIAPKIKQFAANLGKSAVASLKGYLKIKSPSKIMEEIGTYTGEGFCIGMQKTTNAVDESAQDLGKTAETSLTTALSAAYDNLTSGVEDPTIKPVLDLSEIQNGASSIDSMLSRDYASAISANYKSDRDYQEEAYNANSSFVSSLNDKLLQAISSNDMSNLPINLNVQLVGDAEGIFRLVSSENQRLTNMYGGVSPLMRG